MRGRKPKPTAIKKACGNPGHRPLNEKEPEAPKRAPKCPDWLDAEAKQEWKRFTRNLAEMRILSEADGPAIAAYCQAWSRWVAAEKEIIRVGPLVKGTKGVIVTNPLIHVANKAREHMVKLLVEFGMTPSSRSRIKVEDGNAPAAPGDDLAAFQAANPAALKLVNGA